MDQDPQFFLGLDGGQTSTLAVICDRTGRLAGVGKAGPSNHVHEPGGFERLERALAGSILAAWQEAAADIDQERASPDGPPESIPVFVSACCGMTGGVEYVPGFIGKVARIGRLTVDYDLITAHAGALVGEPGVIVIAGTGSVAYGVAPDGRTARAGGWAYLMGDEGSAYDIGRQALAAAARVEDGRGPASCLLEDILTHFHRLSLWEVRSLVYSAQFERAEVAALAPLVSRAADLGDSVAVAILDRAGKDLAELAVAILRRLDMDRLPAQFAPVGGVFQAGQAVLAPLVGRLRAIAPLVEIVPPRYPPVLGAVLIAMKSVGVVPDAALLSNLDQAAHRLGTLKP